MLADDVHAAALRAGRLAYAILDGTLLPIDRHADERPYYSGSVNRAHARVRACGERAVATLKTWKILARVRCCPHRATTTVQAILVQQLIEEGATQDESAQWIMT
ncbi:hypothetical protein HD597_000732 [Nonomuraea thailandensis]|uniref:Transposase n=1 Tax=Nonomuraea thailandensis TaxID=1188745 RepID=A0A9X2G9U3_9ACTN|nr:hypothetical protein [Nonomuraea thailandensis]